MINTFIDWAKSNWPEVLVTSIGIPLIIAFAKYVLHLRKVVSETKSDSSKEDNTTTSNNTNNNSSTTVLNLYNNGPEKETSTLIDKEKKIEDVRPQVSILFIDDDTKFKVVAILKQAGWVQTKIVRDIKNLNEPSILSAHIVFVDIQGVGKQMGFNDQGLGLAAIIKEKYPHKKLIIYSADTDGNRFHKAFRLADDQLPKNALPYEFENIIETMTTQLIQNGVF